MKKTYRVSGAHAVLGHQPGSTFQAELDPEHEARLLERGSVTRVQSDVKLSAVKASKDKE